MDSKQPGAPAEVPFNATCTVCYAALGDRYGWCGNCREAYCFACGRAHFCTAACPANGCLAGLCVRAVAGGRLSNRWGLPDEGPTEVVGSTAEH